MKLTVFYLILTIEIAYCFNCNYVYGYFNCDYYTGKEGNPKTVQSKSFLKGIDTVTNFTINPISDPISIQIKDWRSFGMRVDSPGEICYNIITNQSGDSMLLIHSSKIKIQLNNIIGQKSDAIQIRYSGSNLGNFQNNFGLNSPGNIYNSTNNYKLKIMPNFRRVLVTQLNNTLITSFTGVINITEILFLFVNLAQSSLPTNLYIASIMFSIETRQQISPITFAQNISIMPMPSSLKYYNTRNMSIILTNCSINHQIYEFSDPKSYANLSFQEKQQTSISKMNLDFSFKSSKYSTFDSIKNLKAYYYVKIGYILNQWANLQGQYSLPMKVTQKIYFFANISVNINVEPDAICAFCFTIVLTNSKNLTTQTSSNISTENNSETIKIMICPWRQVSYKPDIIQIPNSIISSYEFVPRSYSPNLVDTYIFDHINQGVASLTVDLMQYVKTTVSLSQQNLSQYYIIGVETGFQMSAGRGSFKFNKLQFKIREESTAVNCLFGATYDSITNLCTTNEALDKTVGPIVSIPNIGLFFKVGPFLGMLDDLSYFVYHDIAFDPNFKYVCELSWNWTNGKWAPPTILTDALHFSLSSTDDYSQKWIKDTKEMTPQRFQWENEDLIFINNCRGYFLYTFPSSILIFLILSKLYSLLASYKLKLANILVTFSSWAYLIISLIGDNLQYLSFRCCEQLRQMIPNRGILSLTSNIIAINVGFFVIICAVGTYLLAINLAVSTFQPSLLTKTHLSAFFLGLWMVARVFSGFIHAFIDDSVVRLISITALQGVLAVSSAYSAPMARYKASLTCIVFGHIVRFFLYLIVLFEALFPELLQIPNNEKFMSDLTFFIIMTLLIVNALQIVLHIAVGLLVKISIEQSNEKKIGKQTHVKQFIKAQEVEKISCQKEKEYINKITFKNARNLNIIRSNRRKLSKEQTLKKSKANEMVAMLKSRQQRLKMLVRMEYQKKSKDNSGKNKVKQLTDCPIN